MRLVVAVILLGACSSASRPPPRGVGTGGEGGSGGAPTADGAAGSGGSVGGSGGSAGGGSGGGAGVDAAPPSTDGPAVDLGRPDVGPGPYSVWVYPGSDGRLVYKKDDHGNQIPDFSNAGYGGGGVALP